MPVWRLFFGTLHADANTIYRFQAFVNERHRRSRSAFRSYYATQVIMLPGRPLTTQLFDFFPVSKENEGN
jgi:hypothetical protein